MARFNRKLWTSFACFAVFAATELNIVPARAWILPVRGKDLPEVLEGRLEGTTETTSQFISGRELPEEAQGVEGR